MEDERFNAKKPGLGGVAPAVRTKLVFEMTDQQRTFQKTLSKILSELYGLQTNLSRYDREVLLRIIHAAEIGLGSPDKRVDVCADNDEDRGSTPLASTFALRAKVSAVALGEGTRAHSATHCDPDLSHSVQSCGRPFGFARA